MMGTSSSIGAEAARVARHARKPPPNREERRAIDALALTNLSMRARKRHRYGKIAGRLRVLRELGRIAAEHGDIAAR
jgi:hypothetical protein